MQINYITLQHSEIVKGLIVCWYLSVKKKVKIMAMLYGRKWRFKCYPFEYKENYALQNCSKWWLPVVSQNKNMVHSCTNGIQFNSKTWQEIPGIFLTCSVLGKNQISLELFLHGPCRYLKYPFSPCNFFNRMQHTNIF